MDGPTRPIALSTPLTWSIIKDVEAHYVKNQYRLVLHWAVATLRHDEATAFSLYDRLTFNTIT